MHCVEEIKNGIYWMGCNDFRTELFERIFPIPEGVTYNSYFIDDEKTCVVDAMDNRAATNSWRCRILAQRPVNWTTSSPAYGTGPCRKRCKLPQSLSRHYGCFQYESIQHDPEFL